MGKQQTTGPVYCFDVHNSTRFVQHPTDADIPPYWTLCSLSWPITLVRHHARIHHREMNMRQPGRRHDPYRYIFSTFQPRTSSRAWVNWAAVIRLATCSR